MSSYWRLAAWGAGLTAVVSLLAAFVVAYYFSVTHAGVFLYGVAIGVLSFTSIAVTAALLGGRLSGDKILMGLAVYFGRLVFAVVAFILPLYLGSWPVLPMLCGFTGVYVVENVVLLIGARKLAGRGSGIGATRGKVERRTGV